jgi:hypothetical protein
MARAPDRSTPLDAELAGRLADAPVTAPRRAPTRRPRRRPLPGWLWLIAGLLIGWLLIGWVIWPVQWTNASPWQLGAVYQQTYLQLVADRYGYDQDLALAEEALHGWDRTAVNNLLVQMQSTVPEAAARQRLANLAAALRLPGGEQSLMDSIFGQGGVWLALALATLPIVAAIGLVVSAKLRSSAPPAQSAELAADTEAELEELLADLQLDGAGGPAPESDVSTSVVNSESTHPPQEDEGEEEEEEQPQDSNSILADLASLFEEEDTSLVALEALCKGLPDIAADELLRQSREVLRRFKEDRPRRN